MIITTGPMTRREPKGPVELYKTYEMVRPISTHTREASCQEVMCQAYANGWRTILDLSTDKGVAQARYIREHSGRSFVVEHEPTPEDPRLIFRFKSGQKCFAEHRVPLEIEPLYRIRGGDYRGNPLGIPTVTRRRDDWLDDFGNHQIKLAEAIKEG
jgi:hypothetical protein